MALNHEAHPIHIRPAAELAERVLLPGDPHRALSVAQALLDTPPRMFNHHRGLWGYTGTAPDGELLTVQSTGMGGPSAAIVCEELISLGARRLIRIGTCGALGDSVELGELVTAEAVLAADGTSAALGADGVVRPDPDLSAGLVAAGARGLTAVSTDLFYDPRDGTAAGWLERGAAVVEMEAAALLQLCLRYGVAGACVLGVTDAPGDGGARRLDDEDRERLGVALGEIAYAAVRPR